VCYRAKISRLSAATAGMMAEFWMLFLAVVLWAHAEGVGTSHRKVLEGGLDRSLRIPCRPHLGHPLSMCRCRTWRRAFFHFPITLALRFQLLIHHLLLYQCQSQAPRTFPPTPSPTAPTPGPMEPSSTGWPFFSYPPVPAPLRGSPKQLAHISPPSPPLPPSQRHWTKNSTPPPVDIFKKSTLPS
jgi:hypothetical protein